MDILWILLGLLIIGICCFVIIKKIRDQYIYGRCDTCSKDCANCTKCKTKTKTKDENKEMK